MPAPPANPRRIKPVRGPLHICAKASSGTGVFGSFGGPVLATFGLTVVFKKN